MKIKLPYILLAVFLMIVIVSNVIDPNFFYKHMTTYDRLKAFFVLLAISIYLIFAVKFVIKPKQNK